MPALVITLGTLYVFRGIDYSWAAGQQINTADMPAPFLRLGTANLLGVPVLAILAIAVLLAAGHYLSSYRGGRELYAIGSEPAAARLSGIGVGRRILTACVLNGALGPPLPAVERVRPVQARRPDPTPSRRPRRIYTPT